MVNYKMILKEKILRNEHYLEWLRRQRCVITKLHNCGYSEAVHIGNIKGIGLKCSDYYAVSICANLHRLEGFSLHRLGIKSFQKKFNVDLRGINISLLFYYAKYVEDDYLDIRKKNKILDEINYSVERI